MPSGGSGGGGGFGSGGFGTRRDDRDRDREEDDGPSRADTVDDWGASRKFTPSSSSALSTGSGGFEDRPRGFADRDRRRDDEPEGPSRADTDSRWGSSKFVPSTSGGGGGSGGGGFDDRSRGLDRDNWSRRGSEPGSSSPVRTSRPRLNLAPRTKPLPVLEIPPEAKLPEKEPEPVVNAPLPTGPPKPKPNPFGAARPREDVLKEKGRDWIKEDMALDRKKEVIDRCCFLPYTCVIERPRSICHALAVQFIMRDQPVKFLYRNGAP